MDTPTRALGQPVADQPGLVGRIIVPDQMHIEAGWHVGVDFIEELAEFSSTMMWMALADDLARGDIERGEQRGCTVPDVVVAASLRLAGPHWKDRLAAVERLYLGLFVDAEHQGMLRWGQIQPDNVAHFGDKIR